MSKDELSEICLEEEELCVRAQNVSARSDEREATSRLSFIYLKELVIIGQLMI